MPHVPFDTLAFANKLKSVGQDAKLAEVQAEITSEVIGNLMENQLATKNDLAQLKYELSSLSVKLTVATISVIIGLETVSHFIR